VKCSHFYILDFLELKRIKILAFKRNRIFLSNLELISMILFRFGQVSPKPTDKIPPLDFDKQSRQDGDVSLRDKLEGTPIPPM